MKTLEEFNWIHINNIRDKSDWDKWDTWKIIQEDERIKKLRMEEISRNFRREYEYWQRLREEHPWNTLDYV